MSETLTAVFDGQVLRPDSPLNLEPNKRYIITIQATDQPGNESNAWDVLEAMTGTIEAPSDWSSEHDRYLYGTPKYRIESIEAPSDWSSKYDSYLGTSNQTESME